MRRISFKDGLTLVEIAVVAALLVFGAALAIPRLMRDREWKRVQRCVENLKIIDAAKEQWAVMNNAMPGSPVTMDDICGPDGSGILSTPPIEPSGGDYKIGAIGVDPTCSTGLPEHHLWLVSGDLNRNYKPTRPQAPTWGEIVGKWLP